MRLSFSVGVVFLLVCPFIFGQIVGSTPEQKSAPKVELYLSLHLKPAVEIPIGSSESLFTMGGSIGLSAQIPLSSLQGIKSRKQNKPPKKDKGGGE